MEQLKNAAKVNHNLLYVGLISLTLFLCPILIFFMSRIYSSETNSIGFQDIALFGAYWISAGLVWCRVKFMWLITTCLLGLVIFTSIVAMFKNISSDASPIYVTEFILSIAAFSGVLLIAEYLNSKSFDRRDQFSILGAAKRYLVNYSAELNFGNEQKISGTITSLSFSGALFEVEPIPTSLYLKNCSVTIKELNFFGKQPVEVIEIDSHKIRIAFKSTNLLIAVRLNNYLRTLGGS